MFWIATSYETNKMIILKRAVGA